MTEMEATADARIRPFNRYQSAVVFDLAASDVHSRRTLMAWPQALFRGEGLWLWGADETTLVHNMKVGNVSCFALTLTPIPGLFFEAGMPFEQFERLLESPQKEWTHEKLRELPTVPAHQKIRMRTAEVGNSMSLDVEGPLDHAVMWGTTIL